LAARSSTAWREYEYGRLTGEISGTGITKINTGGNLYSIFDLLGQQFNQLKFLAKFSAYDPEGNYKVFECSVLVREVNISGSASALSNYSYSLQISGGVTINTTPVENTNPQIRIYEYDATGSIGSLVISEISPEATVLLVYVNGISKRVNIAPDGYTASEVQWNPSTQTLTFGTNMVSTDYLKVVYVDVTAVDSALYLEDGTGEFIEDGTGEEITTG
jgi:hypothetical protein